MSDSKDEHEPMFVLVLLARDPMAAQLVERWAAARQRDRGQDDPRAAKALACARAMRDWARTRG